MCSPHCTSKDQIKNQPNQTKPSAHNNNNNNNNVSHHHQHLGSTVMAKMQRISHTTNDGKKNAHNQPQAKSKTKENCLFVCVCGGGTSSRLEQFTSIIIVYPPSSTLKSKVYRKNSKVKKVPQSSRVGHWTSDGRLSLFWNNLRFRFFWKSKSRIEETPIKE